MTPEEAYHTALADVLDGAADILEKNGRCTGRYTTNQHDPQAPVCAIGAIHRSVGLKAHGMIEGYSLHTHGNINETLVWPLWNLLEETVENSVPAWNDNETTTDQEVLDTFRLAAKQQRSLADGAR